MYATTADDLGRTDQSSYQSITVGPDITSFTATPSAGIVALSARLVYGVSKAAVMHMTRMLAIEWAQHGIRVNSIAPGTVDTPSRAAFLADPKTREMMLNRVPLHRLATADEVAAAVCYLASPEAAYITGHTLVMDGGLTAY